MKYLGDFKVGAVIDGMFNSRDATGAPATLSGTPAILVYKDSTTESASTGITLTVDYDSRTGLNYFSINTSANSSFFVTGKDYRIVITAGTSGGISVVGAVVATFSLENRSALRPTTAGRTLDVAATGEAGLDFNNILSTGFATIYGLTVSHGLTIVDGGFTASNSGGPGMYLSGTSYDIILDGTGTMNGTIATVTNLTNAPTNGDFTATMKTSLNNASPTSVLNAITALNNLSALANIYGPYVLEIPDSSSTAYPFTIVVRDNEGKLVNLDAPPTITAANAAGTDRSANLSAVSSPSTGRYTFTYTVASNAVEEGVRITVSGTVSAEARYIEHVVSVVDYDTLTTLNAINTKLGTPAGASIAADIAAVKSDTGSIKSKTDNLPAAPAATGDIPTTSAIADAVWDETAADHNTAGTTGNKLNSASAPTAAAVADAVWDETASDHNTAGSMGAKMNAAGAAADPWAVTIPGSYTAGTAGYKLGNISSFTFNGARAVTITVNDGATAIASALVRVTQGSSSELKQTNGSGVVTFSLDDGSYTISITKGAAYTYTPETITVSSGATSFTKSMTPVSIPTPSTGQCTGTLAVVDTYGAPESGVTVYFEAWGTGASEGSAFTSAPIASTSNGSGIITRLFPSGGINYRYRRGTTGNWVYFTTASADGASFTIPSNVGKP